MKKFRCKVCNYIHVGDKAPDICPVCKAPASEFEEIVEDAAPNAKKGINKNSNSYTLIYMTVMIVIVSLLLSITSGVLKETQDKNVKLDKMKQILSVIPEIEFEGADVTTLFESTIEKFQILDAQGNVVKELDPLQDFDYAASETEFPVYVATSAGATKYIIPLKGAGLWGAIWGYVALNDDRNTIHGIFFAHAGETPGLGSNIVTPAFRDQFQGKHILNAQGDFVAILVAKTGEKAVGQEKVDGLSGGTITCKGVESMIKTSLGNYATFFKSGSKTITNDFGTVILANDGKSTTIIHDEESTDTLILENVNGSMKRDTIIFKEGGDKQ